MINPLRLAFAFLTRIPLPGRADYSYHDFEKSFFYFPVVGAFIGLMLASAGWVSTWFGVDERVTAFMMLFLLVLVTGGLHLDGLADMTDAFFSGKGKEDILRIMKEPCAGPFGMTAIFLSLIGKFAAFWHVLEYGGVLSIIPVFAFSRWGMSLASFEAVYPRATGTGKAFIGKVSPAALIYSLAFALAVAVGVSGDSFARYLAVTVVISYMMRMVSDKKIGGVTGDVLGAICEVNEVAMLLTL